jgi:hypothetical protein
MRSWVHDSSTAYPERQIPVLSVATVHVTSEASGHPMAHMFDNSRGPGGTQWIAAIPREQTISVAFHHAVTIRRITLEVEEREVARTQEVHVAVSNDGGATYRDLQRQEFNFSPDGSTWQCEDWVVAEDDVTHLNFSVKPDKRRIDCFAKVTSLVLAD